MFGRLIESLTVATNASNRNAHFHALMRSLSLSFWFQHSALAYRHWHCHLVIWQPGNHVSSSLSPSLLISTNFLFSTMSMFAPSAFRPHSSVCPCFRQSSSSISLSLRHDDSIAHLYRDEEAIALGGCSCVCWPKRCSLGRSTIITPTSIGFN